MLSVMVFILGVVLALVVLVGSARLPDKSLKAAGGVGALLIVIVATALSSVRYINPDEVGIVVKNVGVRGLKEGAYIAVSGERGIQADVLSPGLHFGFWPFLFEVREVKLTEVPVGKVGIVNTTDGRPLPPDQVIAPEWAPDATSTMRDARFFLSSGQGYKGTQATVLTTGKYRLNTELFKVTMVDVTEVPQGEVVVLKANFGRAPTIAVHGRGVDEQDKLLLADEGEMGVRARVLPPGKYPINTEAYSVVEMWTTQMIAHYTAEGARGASPSRTPGQAHEAQLEEREITVRTSDGFTFPVDVRVEYMVRPDDAPIVVAKLGDDEGERFKNALNSAVRAIFRNNAESVRALDYVQQRSHQESQSLTMLAEQMARFGVTVTAVRIGNVGDEKSLGELLKTQTDREIAKQELTTFQEQQKAAEQKKELTRATQEAEEEKRLATAAYAVKIAEEEKKQKLIEAEAEAQAIAIRAEAQAKAYQEIALQIGKGNAALIELLKIVGERGIQITPRVMVTGGSGAADAESTALIGTMLDTMMSREEPARPPAGGG